MSYGNGVVLFCLLQFIWFPSVCQAQLTIVDCNGFTRALQQVEPGSLNKVDVTVADTLGNPAEGIEVSLTNTATGESVTVVTKDGVAAFQNLPAGSFSISSTAPGVSIGTVSIGSMGVGAIAAAGTVAAAALVAGGAATGVGEVVGLELVDEIKKATGSKSSSNATPAPTVVPTSTPVSLDKNPTPQPTSRATPVPSPSEDCDCDPDATPSPISPFF